MLDGPRQRLMVVVIGGAIATAFALVLGTSDSPDDSPDRVVAAEQPAPLAPVPAPARDHAEDDAAPPPAPPPAPDAVPLPEQPPLGDGVDARAIVSSGTFQVAAGSSPRAGSGTLHTYTVQVEDGVPVDVEEFAAEVDRILGDERSWTGDGAVALQRVDGSGGRPSFEVVLATPPTADRLCEPLRTNGIFSCYQQGKAVVNLMRWAEGAAASGLDLPEYREYVINHEVGHALGHNHVGCPAAGVPAPIMMQQTKGIGACAPNPWPFP